MDFPLQAILGGRTRRPMPGDPDYEAWARGRTTQLYDLGATGMLGADPIRGVNDENIDNEMLYPKKPVAPLNPWSQYLQPLPGANEIKPVTANDLFREPPTPRPMIMPEIQPAVMPRPSVRALQPEQPEPLALAKYGPPAGMPVSEPKTVMEAFGLPPIADRNAKWKADMLAQGYAAQPDGTFVNEQDRVNGQWTSPRVVMSAPSGPETDTSKPWQRTYTTVRGTERYDMLPGGGPAGTGIGMDGKPFVNNLGQPNFMEQLQGVEAGRAAIAKSDAMSDPRLQGQMELQRVENEARHRDEISRQREKNAIEAMQVDGLRPDSTPESRRKAYLEALSITDSKPTPLDATMSQAPRQAPAASASEAALSRMMRTGGTGPQILDELAAIPAERQAEVIAGMSGPDARPLMDTLAKTLAFDEMRAGKSFNPNSPGEQLPGSLPFKIDGKFLVMPDGRRVEMKYGDRPSLLRSYSTSSTERERIAKQRAIASKLFGAHYGEPK